MIPTRGKVLISEPFLPDPNFSRTVILITDHEDHGTVGFVLNQKTDFAVNMLLKELPNVNSTVFQGGPVDLESFNFIHSYGHITGAIEISNNLYWNGDFKQIQDELKDGSLDANNFKFFIGYSGWAPGQLAAELAEKSWIVGELESNYILSSEKEDKDLWKHAIRGIGGEDSLLANSPLDPNLN
ncbi:MAG: hypothetical protein COA58_04410 [Bacteroidetes bacterium]|nr:MAG: hypothetical protein COA58_04410 [Bacteroidota bacterium]